MAKVGIRIQGLEDVRRLLDSGDKKVIKAAGIAVMEVTNTVARKSAELVPFDSGDLRRSRAIKMPVVGHKDVVGEVTYGGPGAPYAVVQHEDLKLFHPAKPLGAGPVAPGQGRGPKYLEYPVKMARKDFGKTIVNRIKALTR